MLLIYGALLWLSHYGSKITLPEILEGSSGAGFAGNAEEISWDELIPEDWRMDLMMGRYEVDGIQDDDPLATQYLEKLKALLQEAPVVPELDGRQVKLRGFVVPLEMEQRKMSEFLLVPYYGACIHVPPPPLNQTVHVVTRDGQAFEGETFDVVWVIGTLRVERLSSELADAGYRLDNATVALYESSETQR
jgi:hypothetical protein